MLLMRKTTSRCIGLMWIKYVLILEDEAGNSRFILNGSKLNDLKAYFRLFNALS